MTSLIRLFSSSLLGQLWYLLEMTVTNEWLSVHCQYILCRQAIYYMFSKLLHLLNFSNEKKNTCYIRVTCLNALHLLNLRSYVLSTFKSFKISNKKTLSILVCKWLLGQNLWHDLNPHFLNLNNKNQEILWIACSVE